MNAKETKLRYLVNFIAVAALFAAAVALGLTGGDTMKLRITPSLHIAAWNFRIWSRIKKSCRTGWGYIWNTQSFWS